MTPYGSTTTGTSGTPSTGTATNQTLSQLNQLLPGFSNLSSSATGVIGNLLNGTPNSATVQNANATFGSGTGMGTGSGFLANRGYDLYNQQGQQMQQTGLGDLSNLISSYSGNVTPTASQNLSNQQFNQSQSQQSGQFGQSNQLQQFQAILSALGLGNNITNTGNQALP